MIQQMRCGNSVHFRRAASLLDAFLQTNKGVLRWHRFYHDWRIRSRYLSYTNKSSLNPILILSEAREILLPPGFVPDDYPEDWPDITIVLWRNHPAWSKYREIVESHLREAGRGDEL